MKYFLNQQLRHLICAMLFSELSTFLFDCTIKYLIEVKYEMWEKTYGVIPVVHLAQESVFNRGSDRCYLNM